VLSPLKEGEGRRSEDRSEEKKSRLDINKGNLP